MKTLEKDMNIKKRKIQIKEWLNKSKKNFQKNKNKLYKEELKKE